MNCRGELQEPGRRLFTPCKCSGSIRFTHSDCLEQWLEHSGKAYCELCGHQFEFKPLYDADAPDVLPWSELATTVARLAVFKWLPFGVRAALVLVLWLAVAPWCTSWLYRMWLLRASAMVNVNFSERFDTPHVVRDIFSGIILIVCIVFSFLALMSFADFLRFHLDHIEEPADEEPVPHHAVPQAQVRRVQAPAAAAAPGDVDPQLRERLDQLDGVRRLGNLEEPESDDSSDEEDWAEHEEDHPFRDAFIDHPAEVGMENMAPAPERVGNELRRRRPEQNRERVIDNVNVEEVPENEAPPAAAARRNVRNHVNPPANVNREWEDDFEHMEINIAMDELLGLRGDIIVLFRNVSWLLAFNGAYLGLFAFIPYTLGSTLLSAGAKIVAAFPVDLSVPVLAGEAASAAGQNMPIASFAVQMLWQAVEDAKQHGDCLQLVDICTCAMGYLSICSTIVLWRFMVTTASSYIHRPLMGGLLWALRCLTAIVKVSTLLMLKMVVLPIILGLGIDFATLHLFQVSPHARVAFCMQHMIGALMVHWVLGITFMLFVTVAVLQLREVVHPDILAKTIRPQEDHPDLLRTLLSEKCVKHARRMVLSLAIYSALLFVIVHVPVRLASLAAPSFFPLTLRFQYLCPELQVPLELLAVHLVVLSVLEHAKNAIGTFQHAALTFASRHLGLTKYLMPRIYVERMGPNRSHHLEEFVLPPPPLHFHPRAQLPPEELRIDGHRYLPWPEDGLDDTELTEYELLPRRTPSHVPLRVAALVVFGWAVSIVVIGAFIFGSLTLGRLCVAPLERVVGITHDPLVMAAGVEIVWFVVSGMSALHVLTRPLDQVAPALVQRGYCVKNLTPMNAVTTVVGWAFVCPFLLGHLIAKCFPVAATSWLESFLLGFLLLHLLAWVVCTFRIRPRRRRGNDQARNVDANVDDLEDEFALAEDDELFEDEEFDDDDDEAFVDEEMDDEAFDEAHAHGHIQDGAFMQHPHAVNPDRENIISSLRKVYRQIAFHMTVHENEALRLRQDDLHDRCFDVAFFQRQVLEPVTFFLVAMIVAPALVSSLVLLLFASASLEKTAFALSSLCLGSLFVLVRSHAHVARWLANLCESIRNERYLIGRQLQDMAR